MLNITEINKSVQNLNTPWTAASLFSGGGIGDLGLRAGGCEIIVSNELEHDRIAIARANFPEATIIEGNIWMLQELIIDEINKKLGPGKTLDLMSCTAPCQGMSKNGQGTLLKNIREGKRPKLDPRNRLILPALKIMQKIQPRVCIFENVTEMQRTFIQDENGKYLSILDAISEMLGSKYVGKAYNVEFADYGIPQRRQRLITVFTRDPEISKAYEEGRLLIPIPTHSRKKNKHTKAWVSVWDAIKGFPAIDASNKSLSVHSEIPYHRVPTLDSMKYSWVANTPPGRSAFDNQCIKCGFDGNQTHSTKRGKDGINRASSTTPLYCIKCGSMLPRPSTAVGETRRIMSGFTSAYKRMSSELPAPALTRNFSYACSDQKIHPFQNRVLSIAEALKIHTLSDFEHKWELKNKDGVTTKATDALIRLVIGESIPPRFMQLLVMRLRSLANAEPISELELDIQNEQKAQCDFFFTN